MGGLILIAIIGWSLVFSTGKFNTFFPGPAGQRPPVQSGLPYPLNLDPRAGLLLESIRNPQYHPDLIETKGVSLLTLASQQADSQPSPADSQPLPDPLPWFYYSSRVETDAKTSYLQRERFIKAEAVNEIAWYEWAADWTPAMVADLYAQSTSQADAYRGESGEEEAADSEELPAAAQDDPGQALSALDPTDPGQGMVHPKILRLYQSGQPYTGWYGNWLQGWYYYDLGLRVEESWIDPVSFRATGLSSQLTQQLLSIDLPRSVLYQLPVDQVTLTPTRQQILYKNPTSMILTSPPGTKGSYFLTSTAPYVDIPLEVVERAETASGTWLHVQVGYRDLGWIREDLSRTDYVPTYYSERELLDQIETVVWDELAYMNARVGVSFINNETMAQVDINNQSFFPDSTQKIYALGELYHQYKHDLLDPYELRTLTNEDKVPGAGILQGEPAGTQYYLDELVDLVAVYSDNTAANMLIDTVGGGHVITPHLQDLGLYETSLYGKYYHDGTYFTTSPHDAALYCGMIANNQLNGSPWDEQLINKFRLNSHTFLRNHAGAYEFESWNKSGLGGTEQNDVATFVTPYGSYSLAVYTAEPANYDLIGQQMGELSWRVYQVFNELRSQLWITVED